MKIKAKSCREADLDPEKPCCPCTGQSFDEAQSATKQRKAASSEKRMNQTRRGKGRNVGRETTGLPERRRQQHRGASTFNSFPITVSVHRFSLQQKPPHYIMK